MHFGLELSYALNVRKGDECVCDNSFQSALFCCPRLLFLYLSVYFCIVTLFLTISSFLCERSYLWSLWKMNIAQPLGTYFCISKTCIYWCKYFLLEREIYYWIRYFFSVAYVAVSTDTLKKAVILYLCFLFKVVYIQMECRSVLAV